MTLVFSVGEGRRSTKSKLFPSNKNYLKNICSLLFLNMNTILHLHYRFTCINMSVGCMLCYLYAPPSKINYADNVNYRPRGRTVVLYLCRQTHGENCEGSRRMWKTVSLLHNKLCKTEKKREVVIRHPG